MVNFYIYYNTHTHTHTHTHIHTYIHTYIHIYIYIYIYILKIAINPKRYTGIRNISYRWPNRYNFRYGIDSLDNRTQPSVKSVLL